MPTLWRDPDERGLLGLLAERGVRRRGRGRAGSFLVPDNERQWTDWLPYYRTINQPVNFRLVPLNEIGYENYTVCFQVLPEK